jgi:hypothetical protein
VVEAGKLLWKFQVPFSARTISAPIYSWGENQVYCREMYIDKIFQEFRKKWGDRED